MKKKLIAGIVLLVLAAAAVLVWKSGRDRDSGEILLSGNVEVTEVNVAFKIPGRVVALFTDEGKGVNKGDKIVVLDSAEYASQVAQNRATLQNAEAKLLKAKKDLSRYEALFQQQVISPQQLDSARTGYDVAVAEVDQAGASLRTSEERLSDTIIYSPTNGIVLSKNIEAGETVSAGTPIFTLGDLADPWIKVYVKESELGLVKLGQKTRVSTDSYPGKIYEGTVTYISSEAEFTPKNVQTREERVKLVFGVKVHVGNPNNELKPGMPADVKIVLQ